MEESSNIVDIDDDDDSNKDIIPVDMHRSFADKLRCLNSVIIPNLRSTHSANLYQAQRQAMEIKRSS